MQKIYKKNKKTKKFFLRPVSLFLALCAVVFSCAAVSSCGTKEGKPAMTLTYGKNTTTVSSNIYSYYLSYTKTMLLGNLYVSLGYGAEDIPGMGDWPDYWATSVSEDMTYGDLAKLQAEDTLKQLLAMAAYCKENDLALSKDQLNNIDLGIKEILSAYYGNSKSALNSVLIRFNIDDGIYKEIKKYEALSGVFGRDLFDSVTGKRKITDDMIKSVYDQTCARIKHIMLFSSPGTKDVEGKDEQFSDEELAERKAKIDDLYERIVSGGEDFESFLEESEDTSMLADGYTFSMDSSFIPEIIEAMFDMKVGEVRKVESSYGFHIVKKYELLPSDQSIDLNESQSQGTAVLWTSSIKTMVQAYIMAEVLKPYLEKIEIHTDETDLFDIATSSVMLDCTQLW